MVETPNHPGGFVNWRYHVAPVVRVAQFRLWFLAWNVSLMVIDPSLFDKPVSIREWVTKQNDDRATHEVSEDRIYFREPGGANFELDDDHSDTATTLNSHTLLRDLR